MILVKRTVTQPEEPTPGEPGRPPQTPTYRPPAQGMRYLLTGVDGSTWDLSSGPVRLQPGVQGLVQANVERRWRTAPGLPGGIVRGHWVPSFQVRLPVYVHAKPDLPFRDLDGRFWRALRPDAPCTLTAVSPDAVTRRLVIWFVGVDAVTFDRDPLVMGFQQWPLLFDTAEPYWQGATITERFTPAGNQPTLWENRGGVMNLAAVSSTANSSVRNAGDEPAWPLYAARGPMSFRVGVGDSTIDYGPLAAGTTVWIDTHPTMKSIGYTRGANDETAWAAVTRRKFAAIPAGAEVPIVVDLVEAGVGSSLTVELTSKHHRPWGAPAPELSLPVMPTSPGGELVIA